jgi:hypothetical protein
MDGLLIHGWDPCTPTPTNGLTTADWAGYLRARTEALDTGYGGRKTDGSGPIPIVGPSFGPTNPPVGSSYYLQKTKLCFTTTKVNFLGKRNFKNMTRYFFIIFT